MSGNQNQGSGRVSPLQALEFAEAPNPYDREPNLPQVSPLDIYKTPVATNDYEAANKLFGTAFVAGGAPRAATISAQTEKTPMQQAMEFYGGMAKDAFAGVMQTVPTDIQGKADLVHMVTDDKYSKRLSDDMDLGKDVNRELFGTPMLNEQRKEFNQILDDPDKTFGDAASYWFSHPRVALESVLANASLGRLPANLIKYGGKYGGQYGKILKKVYSTEPRAIATAGKAGEIAASAVSNASNTYGGKGQENRSQSEHYAGAADSALISLMAGILADRAKGDEARRNAAGVLKAFGVDRLQNMLEEYGNAVGESAAHDQMPDINNLGKRMVFSGAFGSPP